MFLLLIDLQKTIFFIVLAAQEVYRVMEIQPRTAPKK
jgi:hypothetical protein